MPSKSNGVNTPPFNSLRSQSPVIQIEIHTRKSLLEGFVWVLGTNKEGDLLGQEFYSQGQLPFDNNPLKSPARGVDAVTVNTNMMIDPSGKQNPNMAEVILNEHVLVYAKYNTNQSSQNGFNSSSQSLGGGAGPGGTELGQVGDVTPSIITGAQYNLNVNLKTKGATEESGTQVRPIDVPAQILDVNYQDAVVNQKSGWMRLARFLETEIEPDDRIVIKTLSHKHLPLVGDNWEEALEPIFTGYITSINESGVVGGDELVTLSCACNLHYLQISKFNVAPNLLPTGVVDRKMNRFFDRKSDISGLEVDSGSQLIQQATGGGSIDNPNNPAASLDLMNTSDDLLNQIDFSPSLGLNELINESATTLVLRLLTTDAFETVPVLTIKKADGSDLQYFLQSGVTTQQVSYNNLLGPFDTPNTPLLKNRPDGPNGRLETIVAIPFFNVGSDVNSSISQYYGEWNTVLDLCGEVANSIGSEFFADEAGRMVLKFPTHGVGINLLPNNDVLPNPYAAGGKVPLVLQDQDIISWNYGKNPPALTVIKASSGTGLSNLSDESILLQNVAIVRFDGSMTLGGIPVGGGENLIAKYGIRAQNLPPTNMYLPGSFITSGITGDQLNKAKGVENKLLRSTIIQYALMKGEVINDLTRYPATVTALEDSAYRIGQPVVIEHKLREGDYSDQFGFPKKELYYIQGIQRSITVGQTPTMTLNLTTGRRYPELSGFERAYFSFYQYIVRRHPYNNLIVYPSNSDPSSSEVGFQDLLTSNFGQQIQEAFFTIDPVTNQVVGPNKDKLNLITGDSSSASIIRTGHPIDTRKITRRLYPDLDTQVNDLTKLSSGWSARVNQPLELMFNRPTRRMSQDSKIVKKGDFEVIFEPLLKMNIDVLKGMGVDADVFPDPEPAISQQFQGVTDSKLLFGRILNEDVELS